MHILKGRANCLSTLLFLISRLFFGATQLAILDLPDRSTWEERLCHETLSNRRSQHEADVWGVTTGKILKNVYAIWRILAEHSWL